MNNRLEQANTVAINDSPWSVVDWASAYCRDTREENGATIHSVDFNLLGEEQNKKFRACREDMGSLYKWHKEFVASLTKKKNKYIL